MTVISQELVWPGSRPTGKPWVPVLALQQSNCMCVLVTQSCPMDWSPPGFSVHGILQARILEWVAGSHHESPRAIPTLPGLRFICSSTYLAFLIGLMWQWNKQRTWKTIEPVKQQRVNWQECGCTDSCSYRGALSDFKVPRPVCVLLSFDLLLSWALELLVYLL